MPLDPSEKQRLITDWLTYLHGAPFSEERGNASWASEAAWEMSHNSPDDAWAFILGVLSQDTSKRTMEVLSAGPLEDLLAKHGPLVVERVEEEARRNPTFSRLLGGVWRHEMSADIWARVQAAWNRSGWDGNP